MEEESCLPSPHLIEIVMKEKEVEDLTADEVARFMYKELDSTLNTTQSTVTVSKEELVACVIGKRGETTMEDQEEITSSEVNFMVLEETIMSWKLKVQKISLRKIK